MFVMPAAQKSWSIAEFSQSELVDFAVWILTQTGLKVAPFDQHDAGFEHLRGLGRGLVIDPASWEEWFRDLVAFEHTASRLERQGVSSVIAQRNERLNYVPFVYDGLSAFESSLEQQGESIFTEYYDTISRLSSLPQSTYLPTSDESDLSPVSFWRGSETVRAKLLELWAQYKARPYYRVHHAADFRRFIVRSDRHSEEINDRLRSLLVGKEKFLMFNFVNYPTALFTVVDETIVIGMDKDVPFSIEVLKEQMYAAVRYLLRD